MFPSLLQYLFPCNATWSICDTITVYGEFCLGHGVYVQPHPVLCFCMLSFDLTRRPLLTSFCSVPFACVDPFTYTEAIEDSIPNVNPFLTHPVVDVVHLPVVSFDGVSSRTSTHEMFGGKQHLHFFSVTFSLSVMVLSEMSPIVIFSLNAPFHRHKNH